jgi:acylphosphatase
MITKEYIFSGIVQGMGFRPTALRLATELGITGTVCNTGGRVTLTATGEGAALTV